MHKKTIGGGLSVPTVVLRTERKDVPAPGTAANSSQSSLRRQGFFGTLWSVSDKVCRKNFRCSVACFRLEFSMPSMV
ncbi:hypothetical protein DW133_08735 [Sutterella sp. AM11-39]|nr:hypothetical protein DW133_08735 [Sutterella sp. AM11-39]